MSLFKKTSLLLVTAALAIGSAGWGSAEASQGDRQEAEELQRKKRKRRRRKKKKNKGSSGTRGGTFTHIVTLGDSYASGTGYHKSPKKYAHGPLGHHAGSKALGEDTCYRELTNTPGPRIAKLLGAKSHFGACRGALIGNVFNQFDSVRANLPADGANTLILLSISGNDLRSVDGNNWPKTVSSCILNIKKKNGCGTKPGHEISNYSSVGKRLQTVLKTLASRAKKAEIRMMGYPHLMQPGKKCRGVTGINVKEAKWVDARVDDLNSMIKTAVAGVRNPKVKYVDITRQFAGHGACGKSSNRYINDAVRGKIAFVKKKGSRYKLDYRRVKKRLNANYSSFHPTAAGYRAYFDALKGSY